MVKRYGFKYVGGPSTPGMEGGQDVFGEDEKYGGYVTLADYDALAADLADSERNRAQNRDTAVALQGKVDALEAALRVIAQNEDCQYASCGIAARDILGMAVETHRHLWSGVADAYCVGCGALRSEQETKDE